MTWTNATKPTTSGWANTNPSGRTQYDQSDITYDDPNMFYDGVNPSQWTGIDKSVGYLLLEDGGLLLQEDGDRLILTGATWTDVIKPT